MVEPKNPYYSDDIDFTFTLGKKEEPNVIIL